MIYDIRYMLYMLTTVKEKHMTSQRVPVETKQQQRDESGTTALFLAAIFLNSLLSTQGKIAMDGTFRHTAPRTALYDDPYGTNTFPRLFRKSAVKNTAVVPLSSLCCVRPAKYLQETPFHKKENQWKETLPPVLLYYFIYLSGFALHHSHSRSACRHCRSIFLDVCYYGFSSQ